MCVSKRVVFDLLEGFLDLGIAVLTCAYDDTSTVRDTCVIHISRILETREVIFADLIEQSIVSISTVSSSSSPLPIHILSSMSQIRIGLFHSQRRLFAFVPVIPAPKGLRFTTQHTIRRQVHMLPLRGCKPIVS